jgi:hypothetical protein
MQVGHYLRRGRHGNAKTTIPTACDVEDELKTRRSLLVGERWIGWLCEMMEMEMKMDKESRPGGIALEVDGGPFQLADAKTVLWRNFGSRLGYRTLLVKRSSHSS